MLLLLLYYYFQQKKGRKILFYFTLHAALLSCGQINKNVPLCFKCIFRFDLWNEVEFLLSWYQSASPQRHSFDELMTHFPTGRHTRMEERVAGGAEDFDDTNINQLQLQADMWNPSFCLTRAGGWCSRQPFRPIGIKPDLWWGNVNIYVKVTCTAYPIRLWMHCFSHSNQCLLVDTPLIIVRRDPGTLSTMDSSRVRVCERTMSPNTKVFFHKC